MTDRIRVDRADLDDPRIDEQLSRQQSFGFAAQAPPTKTPLLFRPPVALAIAGLLGALLVWAVLEPAIDDGYRFAGSIDSISQEIPAEGKRLFYGMLVVGGTRVMLPREAMVLDAAGRPIAADGLKEGDSVEILCNLVGMEEDRAGAIATFVRKRRSDEPAPATPDFQAMSVRKLLVHLVLFPMMAGAVGMFVGAADGLLSRAWSRAAISALIGAATGFLGGIVTSIVGSIIFRFASGMAISLDSGRSMRFTGASLLALIMGRGLAWAVTGFAAGIGQGIAMRSRKLFLNGALGGTIGALLGGVVFDPINLGLENLFRTGGAEISRMVGFGLIGAATGLMIGVVELVARDSWVKLLTGPIAGKEFILYRNPTWIGSSPKCEIYLFKDADVVPRHAAIHRVGEHYEIEDQGSPAGTQVSGVPIRRRRLRSRDQIQVGQTTMEFRLKHD